MTVVRSLLGGGAGWLALVVAINAVIGLAYYLRAAALLYAPAGEVTAPAVRPGRAVAVALAVATVVALAVGFAPQVVLDLAGS
ncbi:hypothetical protein GCM10029963_56080 [Micromonospora andamanensis]